MPDNWLKQHEYSGVLLPRRDLAPADLLMRPRENFSLKVGDLGMLLSSETAPPETTLRTPADAVAASFVRSVEVGFGIVVLDAVVGGAISTKLGPDTDLKHGRQLELTYEQVVRDSIGVPELQAWLEAAAVSGPDEARAWLNDGSLAVVTAVLSTAKLSIVAHREDGEPIALSAEDVQAIVGDRATVSAEASRGAALTFEVETPVVFGFQAFRLGYEDDGFRALESWTADSELSAVGDAQVEDTA